MKQKMHLHAQYNSYVVEGESRFSFTFHGCDMSEYGYIYLGERELELEVPTEKELTLAQIAMLRAKEMKIQAQAYKECERVREEIQKLLAIEDKSAVQESVVEALDDGEISF